MFFFRKPVISMLFKGLKTDNHNKNTRFLKEKHQKTHFDHNFSKSTNFSVLFFCSVHVLTRSTRSKRKKHEKLAKKRIFADTRSRPRLPGMTRRTLDLFLTLRKQVGESFSLFFSFAQGIKGCATNKNTLFERKKILK